jgi:hypothetical protein
MRTGQFHHRSCRGGGVLRTLFGMVIHRTIRVRDLFEILRESDGLMHLLLVVSLAGIFAYSLNLLTSLTHLRSHRTPALVEYGIGAAV